MPATQDVENRFVMVKTAIWETDPIWRSIDSVADWDDDTWIARFCGAMAVCVDLDDELVYVTSSSKAIGGVQVASVLLYTKKRLVFGSVQGIPADGTEPTEASVVVVARSSLKELQVPSARNPLAGNGTGGLQVVAVYASESVGKVAIPQGANSAARSRALAEFLPTLLADLDS